MNSYCKLIIFSQEKNPELGMYVHICKVINKSKLPRKDLLKVFNKMMKQDEYDRSERIELINYLETIANEPYNI